MIRLGLVGFGMAGKVFHAPVIAAVEGLELAAVVERHSRSAEAAYPGITTYTSAEAMLEDSTLKLIVVATPNLSHAAMARLALEAGRHVVVDKPVAPTSGEIAELMATAAEAGRMLIPFHNRRWDSDFRTLCKLLDEQTLGRVVSLESTYDRWRPHPRLAMWKEDGSPAGGILLDLGTHLADQALLLFGLPEAVSAEVGIERDGSKTNDSYTIRLRYPGSPITLAANCLSPLPRPRFTVRGTAGSFMKMGMDPQEARLKESGRISGSDWGSEPSAAWGTLAVDVDGGMVTRPVKSIPGDYRLFYAGVRDAILGKGAPPVEGIDAWRAARVLEYAQESSGQRREIACDWSGS